MGDREAGSRHKEPLGTLGNRVTVGHKASAALGFWEGALATSQLLESLWPWCCL